MRPRFVALGLLSLAAPGGAMAISQGDLSIQLEGETDRAFFFGVKDCATGVAVEEKVVAKLANAPQSNYSVYVRWQLDDSICPAIDNAEEDCPTTEAAVCGCLVGDKNATELVEDFKLQDLVNGLCDGSNVVRTVELKLFFDPEDSSNADAGTSESLESEETVRFTIDLDPPDKPAEAPEVRGADSALVVTVKELSGAERYNICATLLVGADNDAAAAPADQDAGAVAGEPVCTEFSESEALAGARLTGVKNGENYAVTYAGIDSADNVGPASNPTRGQPEQLYDLAENYSRWDGGETGGCNAGGAGAALPILVLGAGGLLGLARARRRSR